MQSHHHTKYIATSRPDLNQIQQEYMGNSQNHMSGRNMMQNSQRNLVSSMPNTPMHMVKTGNIVSSTSSVHLPPIQKNGQYHNSQIIQDRRNLRILNPIEEEGGYDHPKQLMTMVKSARNMPTENMHINIKHSNKQYMQNNYINPGSQSDILDEYTPTYKGHSQTPHHHTIKAISVRNVEGGSLPDIYSPRTNTISVVQAVKKSYEELEDNHHVKRNAHHHHHSHSTSNNYRQTAHPNQHRRNIHTHIQLEEESEEESEDEEEVSEESEEEEIVVVKSSKQIKHLQRKNKPKKKHTEEESEEEEEKPKKNKKKTVKKDTKSSKEKEKEKAIEKKRVEQEKIQKQKEKEKQDYDKKVQEVKSKEKKKRAHHVLRVCLWTFAIPTIELNQIRKEVKRTKLHRKFLGPKIDDALSEIEEYCNHQAGKELNHLFNVVKQPFIFVSNKAPVGDSKITVQAEALENEVHQIFDKLASNTQKLSNNFFQLIGELAENDSVVPVNYLTECELKRLPLTRYATLDNPMEWTTKLLILGLIIRGFIFRVLFKGPYTKDVGKAFNVSSIIYQGAMDLLKSNTPVFAKNQKNVHKELIINPNPPEKGAQAVHVFENEDAKNEILLGFLSKIELAQVQKLRRSLFESIKVGFAGWLERIYAISHQRWLSQVRPPKREKREKRMKDF